MKKSLLLMAVALALSGCAHQPPPANLGFLSAAEYSALPKEGTGAVSGQVFMRTVGGDVRYGAGSRVLLIPATSYSAQIYSAYLRNQAVASVDTRALEAGKKTQADGSGNFSFSKVPPGSYYILSDVAWQAPTAYGLALQGGAIMSELQVENDQMTTVMVTK